MQSFGSILLGIEACLRFSPALVIDTIGCSFSYPAFFLSGSRIIAYVHYPFISVDMISRVESGAQMYNNSNAISKNVILTRLKIEYYRFILRAYKLCGLFIERAMVNSRWTEAHMKKTWPSSRISLVYPPCDIDSFVSPTTTKRNMQIVSLAQFRPEKGHALQLEALSKMKSKAILVLAGGVRDEQDRQRVADLRKLACELGVEDKVRFEIDLSFQRIQELLRDSLIGLHTMVDEHFGISVVEFMAAGLITVANDSGGPRTDIIDNGTNGFRASTADEYAQVLDKVLKLPDTELCTIRAKALEKVRKFFTVDQFSQHFIASLE